LACSGVASGDAHPVERGAHALILTIDQGTTGTTCLVVDDGLRTVGRGYREIRQSFPRPGWVEHDPEEIWRASSRRRPRPSTTRAHRAGDLTAIGITNQRETTVVWERASGRPVHPAIVWQDRRRRSAARSCRSG
jgi:glycerol kinase